MEAYMAATAKSQVPTSECSQRLKSEEVAQVKNDFRQNSAHLNQMSFIPVYSNKTVCHKFPKSKNDCENHSENATPDRKVLSTYSPPVRPRCAGNSDLLAARIAKTHIRRRSVGFEDMTSLSSYYGHNFTNDRRFQGSVQNSNISPPSAENHSAFQHSDNAQCMGKLNHSDNAFSSWNHNAQITPNENANDPLQRRLERPLQRFKDKSSKRKSSLNRMDFIQFPNTGLQYHSDNSQQRNNSSSDEGSESRFHTKKSESPSGTAKRKISASKMNHTTSKPELKTIEVTLRHNSPSKTKSNILPRSSLTNHSSLRQNRWKQSPTIRFSQKLSHSAGELESLTDFSEVPSRNKTYSSAQEYDAKECSGMSSNFRKPGGLVAKGNLCQLSLKHSNKDDVKSTSKNTCDITCQVDANNESTEPNSQSKDIDLKDCESSQSVDQIENISSKTYSEQIVTSDSPNHELKFDCDDSKLPNDGVETSVINLETLEINEDDSKNSDLYLSAEESVDSVGSDGEKRPSSILRKKSSGRKELHSILKPTPDDKFSKTPPSILKHRESSEEKDVWQSNDLHSILKKSTSEDESCNSGPDIRPILKLSTDEDSPSGGVRPRPILKKRTSFSDECSYVSFPSGELKPILKKKTPLSSDEQPRPILKSRRKSEDTRSTISEVITSRPRAYSADMGVKLSHDCQKENSEVKKDFRNQDSHDL